MALQAAHRVEGRAPSRPPPHPNTHPPYHFTGPPRTSTSSQRHRLPRVDCLVEVCFACLACPGAAPREAGQPHPQRAARDEQTIALDETLEAHPGHDGAWPSKEHVEGRAPSRPPPHINESRILLTMYGDRSFSSSSFVLVLERTPPCKPRTRTTTRTRTIIPHQTIGRFTSPPDPRPRLRSSD